MDGYNPKSCNILEKPFYRPIEAAIRWCNLIAHEVQILGELGNEVVPKPGQFPQWPCLRGNAEMILDAVMNNDIPHGRDGRTVPAGDHVAPYRLTVRHADLRDWMISNYPDQRPAFLFGESESKAAVLLDPVDHISADLALMNRASVEFWSTADRDDPATHPINDDVSTWLQKHGMSPTAADNAASLIRPRWATRGRKPG